MKRILFAAAATLMMTAPLAAPAFAQPGHNNSQQQQNARPDDHNSDHNGSHDYHAKWRDTRRDARYDEKVHNGYYIKSVWHAGKPPSSAYRKSGFALGYQPWKKGDRFGDFNKRYVEVDYRAHNLPAPRKGQHYVKDDNTGDIILAAIATGVIVSILSN